MARMLCIAICAVAGLSAQLPQLAEDGPLFVPKSGSDFVFALPELERTAVLLAAKEQETAAEVEASEQAARLHQEICAAKNPILLASQYSEVVKDQHRIALALSDQLQLYLLATGKKKGPPLDRSHVEAYVALRKKWLKQSQDSWLTFLSLYPEGKACPARESREWKVTLRPVYLALYLLLRPLTQTDRLSLLAQLKERP
mgnify:FL=1